MHAEFTVGARSARYGETRCDADTRPDVIPRDMVGSPYFTDPARYTCKLPAGHGGGHDTGANWTGRASVEVQYGVLKLVTEHDHGFAPMSFRTREQVAEFCAWFSGVADETWPSTTGKVDTQGALDAC
jgi:hypothetical protein